MKNSYILLILIVHFGAFQIIFGQEKGVGNQTISKLPAKEKRFALIIGVSKYEDDNITPLPGAANDARALRDALRDYAGFDEKQIILLTTDESKDRQPTKNNILRYLGNLSGTVPKDGLLLVAFSGHGIERQKQAFLLASDTPYNDNVKVLERTAISVSDDFKELVRDTAVGQVIILLDACRNDPSSGRSSSDNPLTQAYKDGFSFDVRNKEVEAFATLYATSIGERAYEYTRENKGYFTWAFIEGLKGGAANEAGEVTLGALIRYVEKYVPQQVKIDLGSSKLQRPFSIVEGYKAEELVLGIAKRNNSITNQPVIVNTKSAEESFWQSIENSNETSDFERYLERCASKEFACIYKDTAELKLNRLKKNNPRHFWENNLRSTAKAMLNYDFVFPFSEGLAEVRLNGKHGFIDGKYGFIDKTGKVVIPLIYDFTFSFSEGLAGVQLNYKYGSIDKSGKEVIRIKYDSAVLFSEGLAGVKLNGKYGFIDKTEKEVIPFKYDDANSFSEGLAEVKLNGKYGFIDKTGKEVIPIKYDEADSFSEGLAMVRLNGKEGFIDKTGKEVILFNHGGVWSFSEGLAVIESYGKYGFIDKTGKVVILFKYVGVGSFSDGLARVGLNGKYGFIDKTEKEVIPFKYDDANSFSEGLAEVKLNGKYGFIDKTGKEVIPIKYDKTWCSAFKEEGFIGIVLNGKKGFVDLYGNEYFDF